MTTAVPDAILIRNGTLVLPDALRPGTDLRVEGGVIGRIGPSLPGAGARVIEAEGRLVAPGFVDLHVHGAAGAMLEDSGVAGVERISATLARYGTTSFLATLGALSPAALREAVEVIAACRGQEPGARLAGIHLEGPFLNPWRRGAQSGTAMRPPSIEEFDELQDLSGGFIRMVTVAPELEGALSFIEAVRARGVSVAVGHTEATESEMAMAVAAGVTHVTHLFNAMRQWHHRDPGVVGVALTDDGVSVDLVCDGHHVAPRAVALAVRCKPPGRLVLASDAVAAVGVPDGEMNVFGARCVIAGGAVRRKDGGQLAGSCLTLAEAVRNLHAWHPELPIHRVLSMAALAPAQAGGLAPACGTLAVGAPADIVVLNEDLSVALTLCQGRLTERAM